MEDAYIIRGGKPLRGEVRLSGAKNSALKVIIASLLFDTHVTIKNVPHIGDIDDLLTLINSLGGNARFIAQNQVMIDGSSINKNTIAFLYASKIRVSFMLFAPLLHKLGKGNIPNPGGCRIGSRPIDRHIECMKALDIHVTYSESDGYYRASLEKKRIQGGKYRFEKSSHTGTEFALMLASCAEGETVIENICLEPEVDDLINFLIKGGAHIKKKDKTLIVQGVKKLKIDFPYHISPDRNEAVTFALFAIATKGSVMVHDVNTAHIQTFIDVLKKAGGGVEYEGMGICFYYNHALYSTDVTTAVHPGFMTDWQAPWAVLMTQAEGISTIHETVFENRFSYVEELRKLGAHIDYFYPPVFNPHEIYQFNISKEEREKYQAIRIHGKTLLHNGVLQVSDLRAGASLLLASSVAEGESIIRGASVIDRGYETIDRKLKAIGALIKKV